MNATQDACAYLLARPKIDIRPLALSRSPLNISFNSLLFLRKCCTMPLPTYVAFAMSNVIQMRSTNSSHVFGATGHWHRSFWDELDHLERFVEKFYQGNFWKINTGIIYFWIRRTWCYFFKIRRLSVIWKYFWMKI